MMMARKPLKCHITLNEAYEINEDIKDIFNNVTLFSGKGFTPEKLFSLLKYECGSRLINYKFPVTTAGIQVTTENIEDIQTYVDLFTDKFKYKYLALLESEDFEYNPLDNTDVHQEDSNTRTPNLSGSATNTVNKTTTRTDNLTDTEERDLKYGKGTEVETEYGKTDKTEYHSKVNTDDTVTHSTTSDVNTNSVVAYDSPTPSNFSDANRNSHTSSSSDVTDGEVAKSGYDENKLGGTDTTSTSGEDTESGSVTTSHTGTETKAELGGNTIIKSETGTETNEGEMSRTGFQPQYSISSRQDMVQKYRDISNFSAVGVYISEVANYILLGVYSEFYN